MRAVTALLVFALLAVNLANYWQIQQLRAQVAALQRHAARTDTSGGEATALLDQALPLLSQARDAIRAADFNKARALLSDVSARANQISHTVGAQTSPAAAWL